jgi:glutamate-1-semialdehyde aminotransferase
MQFTNSLDLWEQGRRLIPGGSQTNSKRPGNYAFGAYPIYAARAQGSHIWDVDGNEYVDYVLGLGPISLGYAYPAVDAAIREQLERGIVYGLLSPLEVEIAQALTEVIPCAEMVRFLKSGTEVTSAAARIARAVTGREIIVSQGYHGWHDTWTAGHNDGGVPRALESLVVGFRYNDLPSLDSALSANAGRVAAVILCPTQETAPAPGFLEGVIERAHRHGALVIFDEIVSGFRMALGGAQERYGVVPDLACFAKAIANGMPLAAVCGRRDVMQEAERLTISVTYGGEALSLAAARATLNEYRTHDVIGHLWRSGQGLMDGMNAAARDTGVPFRVDGHPPMAAMTFTDLPAGHVALVWQRFLAEMASRGILLRRGGLNFITFSHTTADIDRTVTACRASLIALQPVLDPPLAASTRT